MIHYLSLLRIEIESLNVYEGVMKCHRVAIFLVLDFPVS